MSTNTVATPSGESVGIDVAEPQIALSEYLGPGAWLMGKVGGAHLVFRASGFLFKGFFLIRASDLSNSSALLAREI